MFTLISKRARGDVTDPQHVSYDAAVFDHDGKLLTGRDPGMPAGIAKIKAGPGGVAVQAYATYRWYWRGTGQDHWMDLGFTGYNLWVHTPQVYWFSDSDFYTVRDGAVQMLSGVPEWKVHGVTVTPFSLALSHGAVTVLQENYKNLKVHGYGMPYVIHDRKPKNEYDSWDRPPVCLHVTGDGFVLGHFDGSLSFWKPNRYFPSALLQHKTQKREVVGIRTTNEALEVLLDGTLWRWPAELVPMLCDGQVGVALDFLVDSGLEVRNRWTKH